MFLFFLFPILVFSSQIAIVKVNKAIIYADPGLQSPIGILRKGKMFRVGEKTKKAGSVLPLVVNQKLAFIKTDDIYYENQKSFEAVKTFSEIKDERENSQLLRYEHYRYREGIKDKHIIFAYRPLFPDLEELDSGNHLSVGLENWFTRKFGASLAYQMVLFTGETDISAKGVRAGAAIQLLHYPKWRVDFLPGYHYFNEAVVESAFANETGALSGPDISLAVRFIVGKHVRWRLGVGQYSLSPKNIEHLEKFNATHLFVSFLLRP